MQGGCATFLCQPLDVLKTRLMSSKGEYTVSGPLAILLLLLLLLPVLVGLSSLSPTYCVCVLSGGDTLLTRNCQAGSSGILQGKVNDIPARRDSFGRLMTQVQCVKTGNIQAQGNKLGTSFFVPSWLLYLQVEGDLPPGHSL